MLYIILKRVFRSIESYYSLPFSISSFIFAGFSTAWTCGFLLLKAFTMQKLTKTKELFITGLINFEARPHLQIVFQTNQAFSERLSEDGALPQN